MKNHLFVIRYLSAILLIAAFTVCAASAQDQGSSGHPVLQNLPEMKFVTIPGLPTCAPVSVQSGDPAKGPSIIVMKVAAGCSFPWHWHTPNENVMLVSGVARIEAKGGKPVILRAGGFAMMPSRHIHQFRAEQACVLYLYSDATFDIHYVDGQGNEISPAEALKAVGETTTSGAK